MEQFPSGRSRPRNSQMQEVTTEIRKKGINMEWIYGEQWRRKINLYSQKDMKTLSVCT